MEAVEERLKSFMGQLQSESGILERLVYKHKNQHRRCTYFQYILKVRRDLKLLKLAKLEEILDSGFLVIKGDRPKQKLQLLESLKRKKCDNEKYTFLERLLGVTRLLSQMVEPLLKSSMEISKLLAQSFFMKFSLTILAVLARIRVLVQQMLVDAVHVYNAVSDLSLKEQTVKLNQDGFEVFREYYPKKVESITILECVWQTDKYVLVEKMNAVEAKSLEKDSQEDVSGKRPKIQYENIEAFLGVEESGPVDVDHSTIDTSNDKQNDCSTSVNNDEKPSDTMVSLDAGKVCDKDSITDLPEGKMTETNCVALGKDSSDIPSTFTAPSFPDRAKLKLDTKKKVAFVSVKPRAPSSTNQSRPPLKETEKNSSGDTKDPFFSLLTGRK